MFPVSDHFLLSYLNAFYRYPTLLRKIERHTALFLSPFPSNQNAQLDGSSAFPFLRSEWFCPFSVAPAGALEDVCM